MQIEKPTPQPLRWSHRPKRVPYRMIIYIVYLQEYDFDIGVKEDPLFFQEAIQSVDSACWQEMMLDRLGSMKHNHVLDLVHLPKGAKPIK